MATNRNDPPAERTHGRPGEFELIERYLAPLAAPGADHFRDDAAILAVTPGKSLVVTQDAIAAGVHFLADDPPDLIARKALRVNLSDLAAKGARPLAFSLALGLPDDWREAWLVGFVRGLAGDIGRYGVTLTGGDTFRSPGGTVISITAWGEIDAQSYRARRGARAGDRLFVTGTIGDGALGLEARRGRLAGADPGVNARLADRYLLPDPPVAFAPLVGRFATASMDVSDGLVGDAAKLAAASGVDLQISFADIPFSDEVRTLLGSPGMLERALTGGDDYQILFTVAEENVAQMRKMAQSARVTMIGTASAGGGKVRVIGLDGREMSFARTSFDHF